MEGGAVTSLAGFQVSTTGRFWVSTEDQTADSIGVTAQHARVEGTAGSSSITLKSLGHLRPRRGAAGRDRPLNSALRLHRRTA